jgi:hypothetical protein
MCDTSYTCILKTSDECNYKNFVVRNISRAELGTERLHEYKTIHGKCDCISHYKAFTVAFMQDF